MKKVKVSIIFGACICLWSLKCLAVKYVNGQLFDMLFHSKLDEIRQAIAEGVDVNVRDKWDEATLLGDALERATYTIENNLPARYAAFKIVILLIEAGAHINGHGEFGWTPLIQALSTDQTSLIVLELLLSYGADPEGKSTKGKTALYKAQKHSLKVLELLTSYSALLQKVKTQPSKELLHECIKKGRFTLVKLLLQCDICVDKTDYELVQEKYNQTQSMAYEIIGKLLKERLSTTTKLGLIAKKGIVGAQVVSHDGEYLKFTQDIAERIGSFLLCS